MQSCIDCICKIFLQSVFLDVSLNDLPEQMLSHIACTCEIFLQVEFSNVAPRSPPEQMHSHIGYISENCQKNSLACNCWSPLSLSFPHNCWQVPKKMCSSWWPICNCPNWQGLIITISTLTFHEQPCRNTTYKRYIHFWWECDFKSWYEEIAKFPVNIIMGKDLSWIWWWVMTGWH